MNKSELVEAVAKSAGISKVASEKALEGAIDAIRGAFSFLSARSQAEERIAQYIIREHHRGRPLAEILNDHYVTNRISPEQVKRLLDRPEVVHELGDDLIFDARRGL